ncbi:MAG: 3-methyl-2-oxobutanoate hydroxymethyltransferase [Proteobacteria bacterium]|nr:3-methyl-2-oxobutanoate hydroxymethyltransferase [Pseudomonadota bacterium]MBU1612199.1 3-methyl-2-oxobutanoate hydroxymethyltransferase [Pseudomonadota bacterium]
MSQHPERTKKITAPDILAAKGKRKLAMMTAYDYPSGLLADQAGMDMVLVGDSLAMVVLGHMDTLSVTLDEMIHHTRATARGVTNALVVGDLPFGSYQASVEQAVRTSSRFLAEGGARAVKLEGGSAFAPHIRAMVQAGIPVIGHIGLTPQHIATLGGFRYQGKTAEAILALIDDALALVEAGIFALVLEAMPAEAAKAITEAVPVPTIGIGAGPEADGQVLVYHDVLGLFERFTPRFVKQYAALGEAALAALSAYASEVRNGSFPSEEHTTHLSKEEAEKLHQLQNR